VALPALPALLRMSNIVSFLRFIRFSHTVFALPFALGALIVAAHGRPTPRVLVLILICMVFARTAAMIFNRLVDWSLDQRNPRTAARHRLVPKTMAVIALVIASVGFIAGAAMINSLAFALSPLALAILLFYSITKRFTVATHFFLGLALGISPIGAWIAQTGHIELPPCILAVGITLWVAGFDLIYAIQDYDFDRREGVHSLVVKLGVARTLTLAQLLHVLALALLIAFGLTANLGPVYFGAMPLIAGILIFEHRSARSLDVAGINRAFFQSNAIVSGIFLAAVCVDRMM
jgi:4-hydroxybenzoate polyprenyltransferase